jgi:hypothetical protein|tara:strand:+ start:452 stop:583 length:132 start_codon:yes stop_codon:yes gene_type:complete
LQSLPLSINWAFAAVGAKLKVMFCSEAVWQGILSIAECFVIDT